MKPGNSEVTGLCARVIPSSIFSELYSKTYEHKVQRENRVFYPHLASGQITHLGTIAEDAYLEMQEKAKQFVWKSEYPTFLKSKNYQE